MPGLVPPVADETAGLLGFLAQQRLVIRIAAHGLTDEQARSAPSARPLTGGGLIKHVATVEQHWIDMVEGSGGGSDADYEDNFRLGPDETLVATLARYDEVAANTEAVVASIGDLDHPVPVPKGVPWFPDDVDA